MAKCLYDCGMQKTSAEGDHQAIAQDAESGGIDGSGDLQSVARGNPVAMSH